MHNRSSVHIFKGVVVCALVAFAGTRPSFAAPSTTGVSGDSVPSECGAGKKADYSLELSGSLAGCWSAFVSHFNCQEMNGFSYYTEIGREEFDGKLGENKMVFNTQYTFNGLFPSGSCPSPKPEKEIVGGCIHYISGDNTVGTIRFYDVMFGEGAPHFLYEGSLSSY
jgi:hypothetical protein